MSDSKKTVSLNLVIKEEIYERLKEQLKLLKENKIKGMENAQSVEDLILFYLDHFSAGEDQMKRVEDKMQSVLDTLRERGVDILELFNDFSKKIKEEMEKEQFSDKADLTVVPKGNKKKS